ncbi:MAG: type II secretion system protein [bacterium]|nr:type II secretion system protein [bacterium]
MSNIKYQMLNIIMRKGFTLIELLIVIGIISILAVAVVLVLNPAQLLAQARDSTRISDLGSIKSAVGLWLATATSSLTFGTTGLSTVGTTCGFVVTTCTLNATTTVTGGGWVAVDLSQTSGGSPLSSLPLDPSQTTTYYYAYKGNDTAKTFELNGRLESEKYRDLMKTDGGDRSLCTSWTDANCFYEVGSDPGLDL